ncbi:MAG: gliding motility protein GldN [Crocinitomicaceae bacterium]|nr:gliding motility protein GldN [Crocinitomicaceae bacterium]
MKKLFQLLLLLTLFLLVSLVGQSQTQTVLDGAYVPEHNPTRRVVPYPHLRQADVMWRKRIWEIVDLRQKMNHTMYFPTEEDLADRKSLFRVIRDALLIEGSISAYSLGPTQEDDEFRYQMQTAEIDSVLNPVVIRYKEDLETGDKVEVKNVEPVKTESIIAYKLKEDWIFDKQRSERYVRIIGIAPVIEKTSESGEVIGKKELFWLYFPECRYIFANNDVFNMHNDAQRMTFDDLFQKRMFTAYVVKEENVYNRGIESYAKGIDALLESERIKNDLFTMEHDLWHY